MDVNEVTYSTLNSQYKKEEYYISLNHSSYIVLMQMQDLYILNSFFNDFGNSII